MRDAKPYMTITYTEQASVSQEYCTVRLDKKRSKNICSLSFFPQCIQVANFYSYRKENISFLVGRKICAWVKKKKNWEGRQGFICAFMVGLMFSKPLTSYWAKSAGVSVGGYCPGFTDCHGEHLKVVCRASNQLGIGFRGVRDPVIKKGNGTRQRNQLERCKEGAGQVTAMPGRLWQSPVPFRIRIYWIKDRVEILGGRHHLLCASLDLVGATRKTVLLVRSVWVAWTSELGFVFASRW